MSLKFGIPMKVRACDDIFQVCRGWGWGKKEKKRERETRNHRSRELRFTKWSSGFRYRVASSLVIFTVSDETAVSIFNLMTRELRKHVPQKRR